MVSPIQILLQRLKQQQEEGHIAEIKSKIDEEYNMFKNDNMKLMNARIEESKIKPPVVEEDYIVSKDRKIIENPVVKNLANELKRKEMLDHYKNSDAYKKGQIMKEREAKELGLVKEDKSKKYYAGMYLLPDKIKELNDLKEHNYNKYYKEIKTLAGDKNNYKK